MSRRVAFVREESRRRYEAQRMDAFVDRLREQRLSITPQRLAIARALMASIDHPRAEDVHEEIKKEHPNVSLATVHRTLEMFCDVGEAKKVTVLHDAARYDGNVEPHHHVVCVGCRKVLDVQVPDFDQVLEGTRAIGEYQYIGCSVEIRVRCRECKQSTKG